MGRKRLTDTDLYDKEWFQLLELKYKSFWEYLLKKCDHAGIWDVNTRQAEFQIGAKFDRGELLETFKNRIIELEADKWIVKKFIYFQYGKELNPSNRVHGSVLKILEKHGLELIDGIPVLHDTKQSKKVSKATGNVSNREGFSVPTIEEIAVYFKEKKLKNHKREAERFWNFYQSKGWYVGKGKMKSWTAAATGGKMRAEKGSDRTYIEEGHDEDIDW